MRVSFIAAALAVVACGGPLELPEIEEPGPETTPRLAILGKGAITGRGTTELTVVGDYAYLGTTTTVASANTVAVMILNTAGSAPAIVDSLIISDATRISDIQVADDARLLVVSTEPVGSILVYDLTDRAKPALRSRFTNANTNSGVHTAEVQRLNGRLYAFLSTDARGEVKSKLVIVDITDPLDPREVFVREMGLPFIHDVFVRDGILFTMLWNSGIEIFDIGGGGRGGTVANPVSISKFVTLGGRVHNGWWYHEPSGQKRYLFIGEEAPGNAAGPSSGDIHVVDVSNLSAPQEVAFFNVPGAGVHNFWMDETRGILYAAYYNGGVRAIDVRGDLGSCSNDERQNGGRCDLVKMKRELATGLLDAGVNVFVWGVQLSGGRVYASDMFNGLWILGAPQ